MNGKEWASSVAENQNYWYLDIRNHYPTMIQTMYQELRRLAKEGSIYGILLELRYIYEAMIRWYILLGVAFADHHGEKELVASLFDPERSLSFGDWVNTFPRKLAENPSIGAGPLKGILINLYEKYDDEKIVRWRNDTVGHGALQQDTSAEFQAELEKKLLVLKNCLEENASLDAEISYSEKEDGELYCTITEGNDFCLAPFIHFANGEYRLFDSLEDKNKQICRELSYLTGARTSAKCQYFFELQERFYGSTPITCADSFDDEIFTEQLEATLQNFHKPEKYWKQQHYIKALNECMKSHEKGVFLFQSESGTGKSTFSNYIDGLGKGGLRRQGITCRCYSFSRLSFRTRKEFFRTLQINFESAAENETSLKGELPFISGDEMGEDRAKALAIFLNQFRNIYERKFGRENLLLVLDGIDELQSHDTDFLNYIPLENALDKGVYILITCRSENMEGTFQWDFLQQFPFSEHRKFDPQKNNRDLLKKAISESVLLSENALTNKQVDRVCDVLNNRFTGLPVIRAVLSKATDFESALNASSLLQAYEQSLKQLYGTKHFKKVLIILNVLALAYEPIGIRMIAQLAFNESPMAELLALMRDLTPLLLSIRDSEGTKYILGHPDFGRQVRADCNEICRALVQSWKERIENISDVERTQYDPDSYIAGGMYLWSKDILKERRLDLEILDRMGKIAGYYAQSKDTDLHMSRIVRIMSSTKSGYIEHWEASKDLQMAAYALDAITACMHKLLQMEDMLGCEKALKESEELVSELPKGHEDDPRIVPVLFSNYANRSVMCQRFGDNEKAQLWHDKATELLFAHQEWIRIEHQIPFLHNCAVSLLQTNPDVTIEICNTILSFAESSVFDRIRALTLESDAWKIKGNFEEAEASLMEALPMAREAKPQRADESIIFPNTLLHYGRFLINPKQDYVAAVDILTEALSFYDRLAKHGALPDKFEGASILSEIASAYFGMDRTAGNQDYKECCLWFVNESVKVYRTAIKNRIRFQPARAGSIYLNGANMFHYYQEEETAFALIDEVEAMQNSKDIFGKNVINQCAEIRAQLTSLTTSKNTEENTDN